MQRHQKIILILAVLLLITWIVAAGIFVLNTQNMLSAGFSITQPAEPNVEELVEIIKTPDAGETPVNPLPAQCVQTAQVVFLGDARVNERGEIEMILDGQTYRIDLAGARLSTSEAIQGDLKETLAELVDGKPVILAQEPGRLNDAGRLTGFLFSGETFVNAELIRRGFASVELDSPGQACAGFFQRTELEARDKKVGMWQPARVATSTFVPMVTLDPAQMPNCDCSKDYVCSDFSTQAEAQSCYNACNDYDSKLDLDRNGIACEDLP